MEADAGRSKWLVRHPYTFAAMLLFAGMAAPFLLAERDWETCLLVEARRMWEGGTLYGHEDLYPYAPFPALVALPFAYLPSFFSNSLFYTLNMACLFLMIRWAWQLGGGGKLEGDKPVAFREHFIMGLGLVCGLLCAWNCISHHQTDVLIGATMIGGCLALSRSRSYLAASCFGVAAAMKGPALLSAPYLAWRGRWKEALWVGVVFVAVNVLPTLVVPAQLSRLTTAAGTVNPDGMLFVEWAERFIKPMGQSKIYPHFWYTESNQSFIGAGYRWLTTTWDWTDKFQQRLPIENPASPAMVKGFVVGCAALLVLATMLLQGRRRLAQAGDPDGKMRLALECGMVFLLMLLFSPMSGKAHFGTMLVPAFAVARVMLDSQSRVLKGIFAGAFLAVILAQNFMGDFIVCVALWHGTLTWAAVLLLFGCGYALRTCLRNESGVSLDTVALRKAA